MFRYEKEMIPIIKDGLISTLGLKYFFEEFHSGLGIVDIVATDSLNFKYVHTNCIDEVFIISKYLDRINKKLDFNEVSDKYNIEKKLLERVFNYLEQNEYAAVNEDGQLTITRKPEPAVNELFAIEAKLKDWSTAIFQAKRNSSFANWSYVAFPANKISKKGIQKCKAENIGLISVDNYRIEILNIPRKVKSFDKVNYFFNAESFASKMVCNRLHYV